MSGDELRIIVLKDLKGLVGDLVVLSLQESRSVLEVVDLNNG